MKKISQIIVESSLKIHKALGPGLLESVYVQCLKHELHKQNITCANEIMLPVFYDDLKFESGFRADLIAENKIIIEVKSVEKVMPVHKAQTLTYLKLSGLPLALLINFGEPLVKDGIHRFANGEHANDL